MRFFLQQNSRTTRLCGYVLVLVLAYFCFAWQHIHLGGIFEEKLVFGNDGDGFFNLWILDHNRLYLFSGLQSWMNGRIFFPDNTFSLLWSDILLIPTLPFSVFTLAGLDRFAAYRLTVVLFSSLGFVAVVVSLLYIRRWGWETRRASLPLLHFLLILLFSLCMVFSINQLQGYEHFQNVGWIGVLVIIMSMTAFVFRQQGKYLGLVILMEVGLLMTAPYFAVIACILLCSCGVLFLLRDGKNAIRTVLYQGKYWFLLLFMAIVPLLLYGKVPHVEYSSRSIHDELATRPSELVIPSAGTVRNVLQGLQVHLPEVNYESPAYVGLGFLLLTLALPLLYWFRSKSGGNIAKNRSMIKKLALLAAIYLVYRLTREIDWLGYGMAWSLLVAALYIFISYYRQKGLENDHVFLSAILSASVLVCIGFAIGPNPHFFEFPVNPSLYGVLELAVPGVSNMRAIGRMSALAHVFLGLWLFHHYGRLLLTANSGTFRTMTLLLVFLSLGGQILEAWPVKAQVNYYNVPHFTPDAEEVALLEKIDGSAAVFPTTPWHKNTYYMLYFNQFDTITLVNGYSARSTAFFDELMEAEEEVVPSRKQLALLEERGCDFFIVHVRKISNDRLAELSRCYQLLGKTAKFAVFAL